MCLLKDWWQQQEQKNKHGNAKIAHTDMENSTILIYIVRGMSLSILESSSFYAQIKVFFNVHF